MQELEKILEEIKENSITVATSKEHYIHPQDERYVEEVVMLDWVEDIIRKHLSRENGQEITRYSQDNDGWIPVEEWLPDVGEHVLGTNKYDEVLIYHYGWNSSHSRKMFFHLCGAAADITAWRPLPEPYTSQNKQRRVKHVEEA